MKCNKWLWMAALALPLAIAGAVYAASHAPSQRASQASYICPLTGEELPCERCCPLNEDR